MWVKKMRERFDEKAKQTGATIVRPPPLVVAPSYHHAQLVLRCSLAAAAVAHLTCMSCKCCATIMLHLRGTLSQHSGEHDCSQPGGVIADFACKLVGLGCCCVHVH
jgi:hypothetical protein